MDERARRPSSIGCLTLPEPARQEPLPTLPQGPSEPAPAPASASLGPRAAALPRPAGPRPCGADAALYPNLLQPHGAGPEQGPRRVAALLAQKAGRSLPSPACATQHGLAKDGAERPPRQRPQVCPLQPPSPGGPGRCGSGSGSGTGGAWPRPASYAAWAAAAPLPKGFEPQSPRPSDAPQATAPLPPVQASLPEDGLLLTDWILGEGGLSEAASRLVRVAAERRRLEEEVSRECRRQAKDEVAQLAAEVQGLVEGARARWVGVPSPVPGAGRAQVPCPERLALLQAADRGRTLAPALAAWREAAGAAAGTPPPTGWVPGGATGEEGRAAAEEEEEAEDEEEPGGSESGRPRSPSTEGSPGAVGVPQVVLQAPSVDAGDHADLAGPRAASSRSCALLSVPQAPAFIVTQPSYASSPAYTASALSRASSVSSLRLPGALDMSAMTEDADPFALGPAASGLAKGASLPWVRFVRLVAAYLQASCGLYSATRGWARGVGRGLVK